MLYYEVCCYLCRLNEWSPFHKRSFGLPASQKATKSFTPDLNSIQLHWGQTYFTWCFSNWESPLSTLIIEGSHYFNLISGSNVVTASVDKTAPTTGWLTFIEPTKLEVALSCTAVGGWGRSWGCSWSRSNEVLGDKLRRRWQG